MSINKVILTGNLGADPVIQYTSSGRAVARMNVATHLNWLKDGEWQRKTSWHQIELWGQKAERAAQALVKGAPVEVEGSLQSQTWTDKEGQKHYRTFVNATAVRALPFKKGTGSAQQSAQQEDQSHSEEAMLEEAMAEVDMNI